MPYQVTVNGKKFFVEYSGYWQEVNDGKEEPTTFLIFDRFLKSEHSFIDIGAWIGGMTLYGAQIARFCYAVEPDPVALEYLKKNLALNPALQRKTKIYDYCISNKCGKEKFGACHHFGDSMSSILFADSKNSIIVKSITLEEFIKSNKINDCNFIKMDIEGGESIVLPSSKKFLEKNKITLHLSLHPQFFKDIKRDSESIIDVLKIYKNIYDDTGNLLTLDELFSAVRAGRSVVATDEAW